MILTGKEDLRVQKTMEGIQGNFHDLILEKEYEQITVKELCERARINKKTFYTYYETLDYLLLETQKVISSEYRELIKDYTLKDMEKLIRVFFEFSEKQGEFYEKITCGGSYSGIREKMIGFVNEDRIAYPELEPMPLEERQVVQTFISESLLSIYRTWISNGKKISVERIIEMATELITNGVRKYMEK